MHHFLWSLLTIRKKRMGQPLAEKDLLDEAHDEKTIPAQDRAACINR